MGLIVGALYALIFHGTSTNGTVTEIVQGPRRQYVRYSYEVDHTYYLGSMKLGILATSPYVVGETIEVRYWPAYPMIRIAGVSRTDETFVKGLGLACILIFLAWMAYVLWTDRQKHWLLKSGTLGTGRVTRVTRGKDSSAAYQLLDEHGEPMPNLLKYPAPLQDAGRDLAEGMMISVFYDPNVPTNQCPYYSQRWKIVGAQPESAQT
ncbi:MAG: hypothetical protein KDA80_05785 [Planctomycetaceae bacterium]|nr:hypothetical protein [Planctomycetaceae bacterium]